MRGIPSERVVIGSNNDDNKNTYQEALLNSNATILLRQHWYMAEKDGGENLGDDLGQSISAWAFFCTSE